MGPALASALIELTSYGIKELIDYGMEELRERDDNPVNDERVDKVKELLDDVVDGAAQDEKNHHTNPLRDHR
ncbi:hypothetical protein QTO01_13875 [Vibrio mytili]|uniref:hypothetical protein n=1 Tax=Vibrio mytili TaxID=50718 RepID=UPI002F3EF9BF